MRVDFSQGLMMGVNHKNVNLPIDQANQQCFPLYSYLAALDYPTVNLLSLDIEGAEFKVFKTIPWDKVDIEVILVELFLADNREGVHEYLKEQGYTYLGTIGN